MSFRSNNPDKSLRKPSKQQILQTSQRTKAKLQNIIQGKTAITKISSNLPSSPSTSYFNYNNQIIQLHEQQKDPLDPGTFKFRRVPRGPIQDAVPILRPPAPKLTLKQQQQFKIPPCISNYKNPKGYTIPLQMRLAADGRNLKDTSVSQRFPLLIQALYQTEKASREEIKIRQECRKELHLKQSIQQKEDARALAQQAKAQRLRLEEGEISSSEDERNMIRSKRRRETERDMRLENMRKKRVRELDDNEKLALGKYKHQNMERYDQRLYNQEEGVDAGFGSEDEYDVYDRPLFNDRSAANIYRNVQRDREISDRPVEFERF